MLSGSCLCGRVAYEVDAPAGTIVHCHCRTCRKTHGSAFSSVSAVPRGQFRWIRGEELLQAYESSPGKFRRQIKNAEFCHFIAGRCVFHADSGERLDIRAGDAVFFPANTTGTWEVIETARKTYILLP